jgi:hypothetical protein
MKNPVLNRFVVPGSFSYHAGPEQAFCCNATKKVESGGDE